MKKLQVDFSNLESVSKKIHDKNSEFISLLGEIEKLNTDLKQYWEGNDALKYTNAIEEQAISMKEMSDVIKETSLFLKKVSEAFKELMEDNANMIK